MLQNEVSVFLEKLYQAQYYQEIDNCRKYRGDFVKGVNAYTVFHSLPSLLSTKRC